MIKDNHSSSAFVCISFMDKLCNGTFIILIQKMHEGQTSIGNTFYRDVICFTCGATSIILIIVALSMWISVKASRHEPYVVKFGINISGNFSSFIAIFYTIFLAAKC